MAVRRKRWKKEYELEISGIICKKDSPASAGLTLEKFYLSYLEKYGKVISCKAFLLCFYHLGITDLSGSYCQRFLEEIHRHKGGMRIEGIRIIVTVQLTPIRKGTFGACLRSAPVDA